MKQRHGIGRVCVSPASDDGVFIETLFRGFTRCIEAEGQLGGCVSDRDLELAQARLAHVKSELQEALDSYVNSRIEKWFRGSRASER